jgi:hypothetical protein
VSNFLGANSGVGASGVLFATDERALPAWHRWNSSDRTANRPWDNGLLWSAPAFLGGGGGFGWQMSDGLPPTYRPYEQDETGSQVQRKIIGTTRDSTGAVLGSCTVRGYVTATNAFVGQVVSDSAGYFELSTPFGTAVQHYLVAYKGGSPDVEGSTVNTLTPV